MRSFFHGCGLVWTLDNSIEQRNTLHVREQDVVCESALVPFWRRDEMLRNMSAPPTLQQDPEPNQPKKGRVATKGIEKLENSSLPLVPTFAFAPSSLFEPANVAVDLILLATIMLHALKQR